MAKKSANLQGLKKKTSDVVTLTNVSVIKNAKNLLKDISWNVKQGEHWAILGANGSGKTTLLKVITGYLWPSAGSVEVLGKRFGEVHLGELRRAIGWISSDLQSQMQQNFTAEDVVLSGYFASIGLYEKANSELKKKAHDLLKFVNIKTPKTLFPLLSFGEQKRVLIARALMHDPKLLVLDEPCAGLDMKAREEFLDFLEQLATKDNSPTILFVTHHIEEILPSITHVLCLKNGTIAAKGRKEEILHENTIQNVLGIKLSIHKNSNRYSAVFEKS